MLLATCCCFPVGAADRCVLLQQVVYRADGSRFTSVSHVVPVQSSGRPPKGGTEGKWFIAVVADMEPCIAAALRKAGGGGGEQEHMANMGKLLLQKSLFGG